MTIRRWRTAVLAAAAGFALAACENPVRPGGEHLAATETFLRALDGAQVARTVENERWEVAPITLDAGETREVRAVFADFHGREFTLYGRDDFSVRLEFEPGGVMAWEPLADRDRLVARSPGTARMRVMIWHVSHPDFISPWMDVQVR
jgi:hypothetical protein